MTAGVAISVADYLETNYRPDCEYVDGEVLERKVGEKDHSRLQISLGSYLFSREKQWGITAFTEQRVQVKPNRFRVPDLTVVAGQVPAEVQILEQAPLLCVEILSRDDRMEEMQERIDEYLDFGVSCVWVINPRTRKGFVYTIEGMREAKDGVMRVESTPIAVPLVELA